MAATMLILAGVFIVAGALLQEREVSDWGSIGRGAIAHVIGACTLVFSVFAAILTFQRLGEPAW